MCCSELYKHLPNLKSQLSHDFIKIHVQYTFSKVSIIVMIYSKPSRGLTFENFYLKGPTWRVKMRSGKENSQKSKVSLRLDYYRNDLEKEIKQFITRQPPVGEKDDYDNETSWISEGLPSSNYLEKEIKQFITRQSPVGQKDHYDNENSWISERLPSSDYLETCLLRNFL